MPGLVRAAVFLVGSLAAGSWVGLGKPNAEEGRTLLERAKTMIPGAAASGSGAVAAANASGSALPPSSPAGGGDGPVEFGPTPQHLDPDSVGSMVPWPKLNPEASLTKAWMVAEGPQYKPGNGRRLVTLTFDDGPFPETTPSVLKVLAKNKIHATFFVIGRYLDGETDRAKASRKTLEKVAAAGHLIGNHTHDHALLTTVTHTQVLEQIDRGASSIERVTGKRPILFRPPFGQLDDFGREAVRERGLDVLLWSVEKQDMQREDSHEVFRELVSQIEYKEGGIVLMHDIRWTSVHVLRELLEWLHDHRWDPKKPQRRGYEIVDLPTYLREVAASPLPYESRDELEKMREEKKREKEERRNGVSRR